MSGNRREPPLDQIELRRLRADCIVGVYPSERAHPQPLLVDLALSFDAREAGRGGGLGASIDYAKLAAEVRFLLEACRFFLLEAAAEALAAYLLAPPTDDVPRAQVREVTVRLSKPRALAGSAIASLRIHRTAEEMAYGREERPFGRVDRIFESPDCGITLLRIAPGREIPTHVHRQMDESEMALGSGLLLQGEPIPAGTVLHWAKDFPHRWQNPQDIEQTILCVNRPSFIETDEIVVPIPAGGLRLPELISYYPKEAVESR